MLTIYKITISNCDRVYIGSTINFKQRKYLHIDYAKYYFNPSRPLYNIIREYGGWKNCLMEIIEENTTIDREQYWIDYYKENVININQPTGMTDEEKKKRNKINNKRYYDKLREDNEKNKKRQEYAKQYYIKQKEIKNKLNNEPK